MKKIVSIVGTRPELIKLSEILKKLDKFTDHIFIHAWQNFTPDLHDQFFSDLGLRKPDYQLNIQEQYSWYQYIWYLFIEIEKILLKEKPDAVFILWDTNSALSAYVVKRLWIPLFHMESWNRCYDDRVPEETNRKIIDSMSTYFLPHTQRSRENLLLEWYHPSKITVIWNPITEVMNIYTKNLKKDTKDYVLVTLHRTENVTNKAILSWIIDALNKISKEHKIYMSLHPKLQDMLNKFNIKLGENIIWSKPYWFKEFIKLQQDAYCVITDSWTVPEECNILQTPCVLMRDTTERPELLENNSMIVSWTNTNEILDAFYAVTKLWIWKIPRDYEDLDVSDKLIKIILMHI